MIRNSAPHQSETREISRALIGIVRLMTYWLFLFWLLLGFSANALEVLNYLEDWETYHRVYRDPLLYFAIVGSFALLHGIAFVLHARGWRTYRFSFVAVAISVLFLTFMVLHMTVGVLVTCCS
jgi:hypothetical protein